MTKQELDLLNRALTFSARHAGRMGQLDFRRDEKHKIYALRDRLLRENAQTVVQP